MPELKPCPFCGGPAEYLIQSRTASGPSRGWLFGVKCKRCGAETPRRNYILEVELCPDGEVKFTTDEREKAADAWNRRADNA